jgi:putative ABC transport system ATP-binding protein
MTDAAGTEPMISLAHVRLTLAAAAGPVEILRGIDLDVARGETVSIVGPSGSGKTSLLMVIAGLERATSGTVRIGGSDLSALDEDALARLRRHSVGIVFQNFHLLPTLTVIENVAIPLEFAGAADARDRSRAALDRVGLGHRLRHYPGQLSGGEQQRVALARAVVARPALILADEPTGNLDRAIGETVIDLLFELQSETGATVLLITHNEALAARTRRTIRLVDGRIANGAAAGGR